MTVDDYIQVINYFGLVAFGLITYAYGCELFVKWVKKKESVKYEVLNLMTHEHYLDNRLYDAQKDGWVICGDIVIKNKTGHCNDTFFHIPMKRQLPKSSKSKYKHHPTQ